MKSKNSLPSLLLAAAFALTALLASPASAQFYMPGLTQAKFDNTNWGDTIVADVYSHSTAERAPGPLMSDRYTSRWWEWNMVSDNWGTVLNPFTGNRWWWGTSSYNWNPAAYASTGFGYNGQMWVEENTSYTFGCHFYGYVRVEIVN